jgi:hypothetical protein
MFVDEEQDSHNSDGKITVHFFRYISIINISVSRRYSTTILWFIRHRPHQSIDP